MHTVLGKKKLLLPPTPNSHTTNFYRCALLLFLVFALVVDDVAI